MSDTRTTFSTIGAAAPDAINDHPTLRHEHLTPERVVNAGAERFELHRLTLEAGATHLAAELERWTPTDLLETLEGAHLVVLERAAVTSEFAARINALLRRRAQRLHAEQHAARLILEAGRGVQHGPCAERVRHHHTGRRGWLVASSDSGRLSLVLWRSCTSEPARTSWHPTTATRLGWTR